MDSVPMASTLKLRRLARVNVSPLLRTAAWGTLVFLFTDVLFEIQAVSYYRERRMSVPWRGFVGDYADSVLWGLFTPAILALVRALPIARRNWMRALPFHALMGILAGGLSLLAMQTYRPLLAVLMDETLLYKSLTTSLALRILIQCFMLYAEVVAVGHGIHYYKKYRDRDVRASRLEAQLAQAQLQVLRMQLHPHFLFNTLHTISALMHTDLRAADRMLALLGDLLRESLDRIGAQEVTLKQELEFIDRYLEIERTRFRDRLGLTRTVDPSLLDALVPNLILQPLVENAIRHGISRRAGGGRIEICARRSGERVVLTVADDGPGVPQEGAARAGVGLVNTQGRLQQLYGAAHAFEIRNRSHGGFEVELSFPLRLTEPGATQGNAA
jgi:two-component system, LytTR family, sensor kinase